MRRSKFTAGFIVLSGLAVGGCTSSSAPPTTMPTTMPSMAMTPPAAKDLTHALTKDEPYFTSEPTTPSAAPAGTLKAGSKVLVVIPGAMYSQVITDTGMSAYTLTDGLQPLGK